ncbi:MAG: hypothetical protein R3D67_07290 [Hyphomicrobiaceae bacterium]
MATHKTYNERQHYWQRCAMRDTYFEETIKASVTEADARKFYDAENRQGPTARGSSRPVISRSSPRKGARDFREDCPRG